MTAEKIQTNLIGKKVMIDTQNWVRSPLHEWNGQKGEVCTASLDRDGSPVYQVLLENGTIVTDVYPMVMKMAI